MTKNTLILGSCFLLIGLLVLANNLLFTRTTSAGEGGQLRLQAELAEQGEGSRQNLALARGALPATFLRALEVNGLDLPNPDDEQHSGLAGFVLAVGDNQPIPNAEVVIVAQPPIRLRTDSKGFFHTEEVAPAFYSVYFSAKGWASSTMSRVQVEEGKMKYLSVLLDRGQPFSVQVSGRQVGGGIGPIEGAEIGLHYGGREAHRFAFPNELEDAGLWGETDSSGVAHFDQGSFGDLLAIVRAPGHPGWMGDLSFQTPNQILLVELAQGGVIEGSVLSSDGGIGVGFALLAPFESTPFSSLTYAQGYQKLDELGRYRFEGIPSGEHSVAAVLGNGETAASSGPVTVSSTAEVQCDLQAIPTSSLRGRITDTAGKPLEGVEVHLPRPMLHASTKNFPHRPPEVNEQFDISSTSDSDGWYQVDGIPSAAGNVKMVGTKPGYTELRAYPEIAPAKIGEFNFSLAPVDSFVAGRIEHAGGGQVSGLTVHATIASGEFEKNAFLGKTNSEGVFRIGVPSMAEDIRVFTAGRSLVPPVRFEPKSYTGISPGTDDLLFVATSKYLVRGRVVDTNGAQIRALEISVFNDVDGVHSSNGLVASADGQFEIAIDPDRDLYLSFCSPGYEPAELWSPSQMVGKDVLIQLDRASRSLEVQVVDSSGNPFEGAAVALSWHDEAGAFPIQSTLIPSGITDANGKCTLRGVPSNAPSDFLVAPGVMEQPVLLQFFGNDVPMRGELHILELRESEQVTIQLKTALGQPALGGCLVVSSEKLPISPKLFRSLGKHISEQAEIDVRPVQGKLSLRLLAGNYQLVYHPEDVPNGAVQTIDFEVKPDGSTFTFIVE